MRRALEGMGMRALLVVARRDVGCSSEGEGYPPPSDASPSRDGGDGCPRPTERQRLERMGMRALQNGRVAGISVPAQQQRRMNAEA